MEVLRTPEERFAGLPDFPWEPAYAELPRTPGAPDGTTLRMAYLDEGAGPVVLLLHGEPSWSFLYRKMLPPLTGAGCRVIAPDLVGFGRSDKPADTGDHTYQRHVDWLTTLVADRLDLKDVTLFCQDWGGLLGLRLVAEHPHRFKAVVAANTGLPDGDRRLPEAWWAFRNWVAATPDLPVGTLVNGGCARPLAAEEVAAYDAPFPGPDYKAGPRAMPDLIPQDPGNPAAAPNKRAWEALQAFDKPFRTVFAEDDPITRGADEVFQKLVPGARGQPHRRLTGAGHFLQEAHPQALAQAILDLAREG